MKIVLAPDSFKYSLSSIVICDSLAKGIAKLAKNIEIVKVPLADGGEGTVDTVLSVLNGNKIHTKVTGPLLKEVDTDYAIVKNGKTAIIEMAASSGISLLSSSEYNPLKTSSYGTGELIKDALDMGCQNIYIGIGGTACNDGGAGMAQALGVNLLDHYDFPLPFGGKSLSALDKIDITELDERLAGTNIIGLYDVDNPLCGLNGASYIYGPQKGASPENCSLLDESLSHYAKQIKKQMGKEVLDIPGSGAGGGMGAGMLAFLDAKLERGIDFMIRLTQLEEKIQAADLIITGEGQLDAQTENGKTVHGVAELARKYKIPVIAVAGSISNDAELLYKSGISSMFSICDRPMKLEESISQAPYLLAKLGENIVRNFLAGSSINHKL